MEEPIPKLPYNIYWINLDRRQDRKEHMEKILILNKDNSFRINAIDYKNNFNPYNIIKHSKISNGHHGCTSSHIKALYSFLTSSQDEYCFIVEDDLSNIYSTFWKPKHYDILKNFNCEILQLQTTEGIYNDSNLDPLLLHKNCSGATIYRIKRNIANKIIDNHYDYHNKIINLSNHNYPVADNLIWDYGTVYMLPMFSYLDVTDSDTSDTAKNINQYWKHFFSDAKEKYLKYWKES